MKVTCLIDSLGSGGAQRQLCTLAVLLKQRGLDVSLLTYHPDDFFLPLLRNAGIPYHCLNSRSPRHHVRAVRHALRQGDQDVVLAFLEGACLYAELAGLPFRRWGLVVSERLAVPGSDRSWRRWLWKAHRLADYVTTNSHANRLLMERSVGGIKSRVVTIYNAVDLDAFPYAPLPPSPPGRCLRLVVAASYQAKKNAAGFVQAVALAQSRLPAVRLSLDWYGGVHRNRDGTIDREAFAAAERCIQEHQLTATVRLHPASPHIAEVYRGADAVALPSFYEGLPNVICEAMATGRPILMSNVCDAANLVKDGENGFLFDPASPEDMARAIEQLALRSPAEREAMGRQSRRMAERMFDPRAVAARYAEVLSAAAARKRTLLQHWVPEVPSSAICDS